MTYLSEVVSLLFRILVTGYSNYQYGSNGTTSTYSLPKTRLGLSLPLISGLKAQEADDGASIVHTFIAHRPVIVVFFAVCLA